jgi:predicted ATPase/DNA-binding winged helix-turn-helix (wHTH) protein
MVHGTTAAPRLRFGSFELQLDERRLLADGAEVPLRPLAFDVLAVLVERAGSLVTKDDLLQRVWGTVVVEENTLQAHISALRKVFGREAIHTVIGQGYRFMPEVVPVQMAAGVDAAVRHNLPQPLTRFIGREREIEQIRSHLAGVRLLTLIGAGGCGKTRLAREVATASVDQFADGVWMVELAPLSDPTLMVQALSRALSLEAYPGRDLGETLLDHLRPRRLLLVLDNAEHLLQACAEWAERLLRQCAGLTLLVTSRERLGLDGEMAWRVPSLSVPLGVAGEDPVAFEATKLFVDRARLHRPDFELVGDEVALLSSVCRRLDGIALAIELAAAQMRFMSIKALHQGLDDRFHLLTNGSRSALPRHRTLGSLIEWSHDRLTPQEQVLLRRVAVFAGGWTLASAERVCGGQGFDAADFWLLLTTLVDKSLVVVEAGADEPRFGLLETVRHFALKRLDEAGETVSLRDRHLAYLSDLAAGLDPSRTDDEVQRTLFTLQVEVDNLRAALEWCESDPARALVGLRMAGHLNWFWNVQSAYKEGRAWISRLLKAAEDAPQGEAHAAALVTGGTLATFDGEPAAGVAPLRRAIELWRELGNRQELLRALSYAAEAQKRIGDHAAGRRHYEDALAIAREIDAPRSVALCLMGVGVIDLEQGDAEAARPLLEEALAIGRGVGPWVAGYVGGLVGEVLHACGELQAARDALTEAVAQLRGFGDPENLAHACMHLALVCQDLRDLAAARDFLQIPLDQYPRIFGSGQLSCLEAFAGLLSELADPLVGARLWGCVERHAEEKQRPHEVLARSRQRRLQQLARQALQDDAAFDRAWNEGREWSLDQAFLYARAQG